MLGLLVFEDYPPAASANVLHIDVPLSFQGVACGWISVHATKAVPSLSVLNRMPLFSEKEVMYSTSVYVQYHVPTVLLVSAQRKSLQADKLDVLLPCGLWGEVWCLD